MFFRTPKDSPAVPASATTHELFRGFSYVAPLLNEDAAPSSGPPSSQIPTSQHTTPQPMNNSLSSGLKSAKSKTSPFCFGKTGSFAQEYELLEEIGQGSYSVCRRCVHRATRSENTVKIGHKSQISKYKYTNTKFKYTVQLCLKLT